MICRELLHNPTAVVGFDWLNDYKDTRFYLQSCGDLDMVRLLRVGHSRWLVREWGCNDGNA